MQEALDGGTLGPAAVPRDTGAVSLWAVPHPSLFSAGPCSSAVKSEVCGAVLHQ